MCGPATRAASASRRDVDAAAQFVRTHYAYRAEKQVDWPRAERLAAAAADTVQSRRALVGVLERLLDNLYDPHATLRTNTAQSARLVPSGLDLWAEWRPGADGALEAIVSAVRPGYSAEQAGVRPGMRIDAVNGVPVATAAEARLGPAVTRPAPAAARQWALLSALAGRHDTPRVLRVRDAAGQDRDLALDLPGQRGVDAPAARPPLDVRRLATAIGYVRVNDALGDVRTVPAFDSALTALRDTRALILDLRDTPGGGNTGVAEPMLGRLLTRAAAYQRVVPLDAPATDRVVQPRGPWAYVAPVVVLVGRWTGSMGEGLAMGLSAIQVAGRSRAVVVGTAMAGLAGAVDDVTLPCSGIQLALPTARLLHPDGTPRERWRPPIVVDLAAPARVQAASAPSPAGRGADPVLARGLAQIGEP